MSFPGCAVNDNDVFLFLRPVSVRPPRPPPCLPKMLQIDVLQCIVNVSQTNCIIFMFIHTMQHPPSSYPLDYGTVVLDFPD